MNALEQLAGDASAFPTDLVPFLEGHLRPRGRRSAWSWAGHEYARAIAECTAREIVLQKPAQIIGTTFAIGAGLQAVLAGLNVGYFLSSRDRVKRFVQKRVNPLINADPALATAVTGIREESQLDAAARRGSRKGADNTLLIQFGDTFFSFSGLQSLEDAKSDPLDFVICDEVDELDPEIAIWLDDRLLHSAHKRRLWLSQPSLPNIGINAVYEQSDQRHYLHKCPACGHWQALEDQWPANLYLRSTAHRSWHPVSEECRLCDPLPDEAIEVKLACVRCLRHVRIREGAHPARTEWVAKYPGRERAGFQLSQLYGPAVTVRELWTKWRHAQGDSRALRNFWISKIGKPYAGERQPASADVVEAAAGDWLLGLREFLQRDIEVPLFARVATIAGADVGNGLIYALGGVLYESVTYCCDVRVFKDERQPGGHVRSAWDQFRAWLAGFDYFVVDGAYDRSEARITLRTEGLTGAMAFFPTNCQELSARLAEEQVDSDLRYVKQDKTTAIDDMAMHLRGRTLRLPSLRCEIMSLLRAHCEKLYKVAHPRTGILQYQDGVENHLGLAATYLDLAAQTLDLFGLAPAAPLGDTSSYVARGSLLPRLGEGPL